MGKGDILEIRTKSSFPASGMNLHIKGEMADDIFEMVRKHKDTVF